MSAGERFFDLTVAGQAMAIIYLALVVFLTATSESEFQVTPGIALLLIALPLGWYAGKSLRGAPQADPAMLTVIVPNAALLGLCLAGSLPVEPTSSGLPSALVAFVAAMMIGTAWWLTRARRQSDSSPAATS